MYIFNSMTINSATVSLHRPYLKSWDCADAIKGLFRSIIASLAFLDQREGKWNEINSLLASRVKLRSTHRKMAELFNSGR
jgi:hypothetical protein